MAQDAELRVVVALLANALNVAVAALSHLSEYIPDAKVRAEALEAFEDLAETTDRIVSIFPTTLPGPDNVTLH